MSGCLGRLMPHVRRDGIAITGGVAMQLGMARCGARKIRETISDLDLVAVSIDAIEASVAEQFLVSHYHAVRPGISKFMIQLVDPGSNIRVDIFPDLAGSLADSHVTMIGEHWIRILPLQRIFEHTLLTLSRASGSAPIDPKHVRDAKILGGLLDRPVPDVEPQALAPDVHGGEADRCCERCELSTHPNWPLAQKDRIFEILGWTG